MRRSSGPARSGGDAVGMGCRGIIRRRTMDKGRAMFDRPNARGWWVHLLFFLLLLIGVATVVIGAREVLVRPTQTSYLVLGIGLLTVVVPAAVYPFATTHPTGELDQRLSEQRRLLEQIAERELISDQAKRILYRQKERETLRQAIAEDIQQQDYDAAMALVNELANTYGVMEEAEQFRQEIHQARTQQRQVHIDSAVARVEEMLRRREWERANHEANRLQRIYPDAEKVQELPKRIAQASEERKHELERAFLEAASNDDVERAMSLMAELDKYLTPEEAQPYLETARGVIGQKRENLGVRFKMAVQDRDWVGAVNTGEQILREFPNTKMASEVRSVLDTLRQNAAQQRAASEGSTG